MRPPALRVHAEDLIVDNFAGGGGASLGIEWALGRSPDVAINHDEEAIAMHAANHPGTRHLCGDVWDVAPKAACVGRPVALAWFSPDCKHFSRAKGTKPVEKRIRGLAWVVVRWAKTVRPRVIILENVEEFADWGPLLDDNRPDPARKGLTFRRWWGSLVAAGYQVEMRQLRASDYGAPTSRNRLFIIARSDGGPIVWPEPTHGPHRAAPHRTAAECIEWAVPCPSIFERTKPLAEKTLRRIGRGIWRFVLGKGQPFIVPVAHGGDDRVHGLDEPVPTVTGGHRGELALVAAFLAKHYGGHETPGTSPSSPLSTVTVRDHHHLVTSHMLKLYGTCPDGQSLSLPFPTVRAEGTHLGEVRAFLLKYNRTSTSGRALELPLDTVTTRDRFGLVRVEGDEYAITDIGMRMLVPRELFRAQGFPDSYCIDPAIDGAPLSKTAQVRMCGNSVVPQIARDLVLANVARKEVAVA